MKRQIFGMNSLRVGTNAVIYLGKLTEYSVRK